MPVYTGLRAVSGAGIELLQRVDALPGTGTAGQKIVLKGTGIVYEWTGSWTSLGPAAPSGGGGSGNLDGGFSTTVYGGTTPVDGGGA